MGRRSTLVALSLLLLVGWNDPHGCHAQARVPKMSAPPIDHAFSIAGDPDRPLPDRIAALDELARHPDPALVPGLRALWTRKRPAGPAAINWDPAAAERVVDLHVIRALVACGDVSLVPEIAALVARAGRVLQGPDDELRHAARVIRAIGRPEPLEQLIALGTRGQPPAVGNAVRTLQLLGLPSPASGGSLAGFPELAAPVAFTIHRLREEVETLERLSHGRIALSSGTREQIARHDFDRGEVRREDTSLAEILEQEIDMLDLTYAVTRAGVVICTFAEAADRWQRGWAEHRQLWVGALARPGTAP